MYFPSKKDTWVALMIWGVIISVFLLNIFGEAPFGLRVITYESVIANSILIFTIIFLLWLWFGTGYKIENGLIKIRCGPFRSTVNIKEIKKISVTKNPLAAPALSHDRLEILHGKYNIAIVSPINKMDFIKLLVTENPAIQMDKNLLDSKNI